VTKDPNKASGDAAATLKVLQDALNAKNLTALDVAPAVDTNAFVVTKATADKNKLAKVSDLGPVASSLVLGGPPECPQRPFCIPGLEKTYGVKFKDFKPLDAGGPLTVAALENSQVDVALLFSTNAQISAKNLVVLQDDKHLQQADNIVPVVRNDLLSKAPGDFKTLINGVSAKLTTDELSGLNKKLDVDKQDPKAVAGQWLKQKGLVK
jgi:osmoprotectant transport system substrate-binding protein